MTLRVEGESLQGRANLRTKNAISGEFEDSASEIRI